MPHINRTHLTYLTFALAISILAISIGVAPARATESERSILATFEGTTLSLAQSWGEAQACITDGEVADCYRDEVALRAAHGLETKEPEAARLANCGSSTVLYSDGGYTGYALYVTGRGTWVNLDAAGFNDAMSSYAIGACSAYLADNVGGGGSWYPTHLTTAWAASAVVEPGWNDRVSSIYLT